MNHTAAGQERCEPGGIRSRELDLLGLGIAGLLADDPCHYSPLVILGPAADTTSCLQDIARHWDRLQRVSDRGPRQRAAALLIDAVTLAADLEAAVGEDLDRVHRRWTRSQLLLIDGINGHHLRPRHLHVLPHLLDRAAERGSRLVVGLGRGRGQPQLPEPIASRLEAGLMVMLPDTQAASMPSSQIGAGSAQRLTVRRIVSTTASHFGLLVADLTGPSRRRTAAVARGIAMHLIRELCSESLAEIGGHFGGRDHTTVLHAIRVTRHRCEHDASLAGDLEAIVHTLSGR